MFSTPNFGPMVVSLSGPSLTQEEIPIIQHPQVGGVILFTRNYQSQAQLKALIHIIRAIAQLKGKQILVAVDHEGYLVQRFRHEFTRLPPPQLFGETFDQNEKLGQQVAKKFGFLMARELKDCGVDISFAPVADLDAGNEVITKYRRAFHRDPSKAIQLLQSYIDGMHAGGMLSTLKHYPGHGQKIGDSHLYEPIDRRSRGEIEQNDLRVFSSLIHSGHAHAVMPAHIVYPAIDPENTAGTSRIWLEEILRKQYGYNGVIISDCLSMKGAGQDTLLDKTRKALQFGDIALLCNQKPAVFLELLNSLDFEQPSISRQRIATWIKGPSIALQQEKHTALVFEESWQAQKRDLHWLYSAKANDVSKDKPTASFWRDPTVVGRIVDAKEKQSTAFLP